MKSYSFFEKISYSIRQIKTKKSEVIVESIWRELRGNVTIYIKSRLAEKSKWMSECMIEG